MLKKITTHFLAFISGIVLSSTVENFIWEYISHPAIKKIFNVNRSEAEILSDDIGQFAKKHNLIFNKTEQISKLIQSLGTSYHSSDSFKREVIINFIMNSSLKSDQLSWQEIFIVSELIKQMEEPAFSLIRILSKCSREAILYKEPNPRVYEKVHDLKNPNGTYYEMKNNWTLIQEWTDRLRKMGIVRYAFLWGSQGAFGNLHLTEKGHLFAKWTNAQLSN